MLILPGPPSVAVTLRRSARARRFSLRVRASDGLVTLSLPLRARMAEATAFVTAQEGWIRAALARLPVAPVLGPGALIPFEGEMMRLDSGPGRSVRTEPGRLILPGDPAQMPARLAAFLKVRARDRLVAASDHHAGRIGRKVARITLRDTRSRWGSCAADGALMYSWRLIMAPPSVLSYVAAHEVAHLVEMNHSARFWAVVEQLFPGWQAERAWLRREGAALQAIRFDSAFDSAGD